MIDLSVASAKTGEAGLSELNEAAVKHGSSVVAICSHKHEVSELVEAGIRVHVEKPLRRAKISWLLSSRPSTEQALPSAFRGDVRPPFAPRPSAQGSWSANGMKILVAEDNAINQRVVQAHLQALGYEVDTASDGVAALEALDGGALLRRGHHGWSDAKHGRVSGHSSAKSA